MPAFEVNFIAKMGLRYRVYLGTFYVSTITKWDGAFRTRPVPIPNANLPEKNTIWQCRSICEREIVFLYRKYFTLTWSIGKVIFLWNISNFQFNFDRYAGNCVLDLMLLCYQSEYLWNLQWFSSILIWNLFYIMIELSFQSIFQ